MHSMLLRIKGRPAAIIAEYNVWVDVRIQVGNTIATYGTLESSDTLAGWIVRASPSAVVCTITVNIHVIVVA